MVLRCFNTTLASITLDGCLEAISNGYSTVFIVKTLKHAHTLWKLNKDWGENAWGRCDAPRERSTPRRERVVRHSM